MESFNVTIDGSKAAINEDCSGSIPVEITSSTREERQYLKVKELERLSYVFITVTQDGKKRIEAVKLIKDQNYENPTVTDAFGNTLGVKLCKEVPRSLSFIFVEDKLVRMIYGMHKFGSIDEKKLGSNIQLEYAIKKGDIFMIRPVKKANGEAGGLSAIMIDAVIYYIVSSKNVQVCVQSVEELANYKTDQKYTKVFEIATRFFDLVKQLAPEQISDLDQILLNHTIALEHVGEFHHIVIEDKGLIILQVRDLQNSVVQTPELLGKLVHLGFQAVHEETNGNIIYMVQTVQASLSSLPDTTDKPSRDKFDQVIALIQDQASNQEIRATGEIINIFRQVLAYCSLVQQQTKFPHYSAEQLLALGAGYYERTFPLKEGFVINFYDITDGIMYKNKTKDCLYYLFRALREIFQNIFKGYQFGVASKTLSHWMGYLGPWRKSFIKFLDIVKEFANDEAALQDFKSALAQGANQMIDSIKLFRAIQNYYWENTGKPRKKSFLPNIIFCTGYESSLEVQSDKAEKAAAKAAQAASKATEAAQAAQEDSKAAEQARILCEQARALADTARIAAEAAQAHKAANAYKYDDAQIIAYYASLGVNVHLISTKEIPECQPNKIYLCVNQKPLDKCEGSVIAFSSQNSSSSLITPKEKAFITAYEKFPNYCADLTLLVEQIESIKKFIEQEPPFQPESVEVFRVNYFEDDQKIKPEIVIGALLCLTHSSSSPQFSSDILTKHIDLERQIESSVNILVRDSTSSDKAIKFILEQKKQKIVPGPLIVLFTGIPGTGKDTLAENVEPPLNHYLQAEKESKHVQDLDSFELLRNFVINANLHKLPKIIAIKDLLKLPQLDHLTTEQKKKFLDNFSQCNQETLVANINELVKIAQDANAELDSSKPLVDASSASHTLEQGHAETKLIELFQLVQQIILYMPKCIIINQDQFNGSAPEYQAFLKRVLESKIYEIIMITRNGPGSQKTLELCKKFRCKIILVTPNDDPVNLYICALASAMARRQRDIAELDLNKAHISHILSKIKEPGALALLVMNFLSRLSNANREITESSCQFLALQLDGDRHVTIAYETFVSCDLGLIGQEVELNKSLLVQIQEGEYQPEITDCCCSLDSPNTQFQASGTYTLVFHILKNFPFNTDNKHPHITEECQGRAKPVHSGWWIPYILELTETTEYLEGTRDFFKGGFKISLQVVDEARATEEGTIQVLGN